MSLSVCVLTGVHCDHAYMHVHARVCLYGDIVLELSLEHMDEFGYGIC